MPVQAVEGNQVRFNFTVCSQAITADICDAEMPRLAGHGLHPLIHGLFGGHEHRNVRRLVTDASSAPPLPGRTQVCGQHQRPPQNGGDAGIVGRRLQAKCLGQGQLYGIA